MIALIVKVINRLTCFFYRKKLECSQRKKFSNLRVLGHIYIENCTVDIGKNVVLWPGVSFTGNGHIKIGSNVKIGQNTIIYASKNGGVEIGDNSIIAAQTYIIDSNHLTRAGANICDQELTSLPVLIGEDVWIGAQCMIIRGASIGNGCVIGAHSVVNKSIPSGKIAYGTPASVKKDRI